MSRKAWLFIAITLGLTWPLEWALVARVGGDLAAPADGVSSGLLTAGLVGIMFVPALSALIVQRGVYGEPIRDLGVHLHLNRWWGVAVILPVVAAAAVVGASVLLPHVSLASGAAFIIEQLNAAALPPEQVDAVRADIEAQGAWFGPILAAVIVGAALLAGPTINAIPALGEELGWRGLLQKSWAPAGFWTSSLAVGLVWSVWHLPLVANGYNYPDAPVRGPLLMTVFCVLWSPLLAYVTVRGRSVLLAAAMHGTLNAIAGAPLYFLDGGSRTTTSLLGLTGFAVLIGANALVWWHQQRTAAAFQRDWHAWCESSPPASPSLDERH
jgi:membrane protease YdiL (CAAX protease family)